MFSARVALSTVALILAALASANPVQQAVLDDVATGLLNRLAGLGQTALKVLTWSSDRRRCDDGIL